METINKVCNGWVKLINELSYRIIIFKASTDVFCFVFELPPRKMDGVSGHKLRRVR